MSQKQWGNITWILFHSLAESIDPNLFIQAKPLVILLINSTCKNLPCPYLFRTCSKFTEIS